MGTSIAQAFGMLTQMLGWLAVLVVLATVAMHVFELARSRATSGGPRWALAGQALGSFALLVYSTVIGNWVFAAASALVLSGALAGHAIVVLNRRREARAWADRVLRISRRQFHGGRSGRGFARSFAR
jgi:hypothetical protein